MRSVWTATSIVLLVHAMLLASFAGWLYSSGRLNRDRMQQAVAFFRPTIEQEKQQVKQAAALEAEARAVAEDAARLERAEDGVRTLLTKLETEKQADDVAALRIERLRAEIAQIRAKLETDKTLLARMKEQLDAERQAFREEIDRELARQQAEDFKTAVRYYESLKPKHAKQLFQDLLGQGEAKRVVDYLAAMQVRNGAAIISEFKAEDEVPLAADLIDRLRDRGVDLVQRVAPGSV